MEGKITVKYHDAENRHFTIIYDSVRMDVHRTWDLEKDRFEAAYKLYLGIKQCMHPMQAAGLLHAAEDEVRAYLPAIVEAQSNKDFNYSIFLQGLAEKVQEDIWAYLVFNLPVTKIFSEKKSLRGDTLESKFVDLIPLYGPDYIHLLKHKLSSAFTYLTEEQANRLIKIAYERLNPQPQASPSPIIDNKQLLRRQSQKFLDWFRAGNRKE